jgi:hypothetical protein
MEPIGLAYRRVLFIVIIAINIKYIKVRGKRKEGKSTDYQKKGKKKK